MDTSGRGSLSFGYERLAGTNCKGGNGRECGIQTAKTNAEFATRESNWVIGFDILSPFTV
jgi:hypothetical protein